MRGPYRLWLPPTSKDVHIFYPSVSHPDNACQDAVSGFSSVAFEVHCKTFLYCDICPLKLHQSVPFADGNSGHFYTPPTLPLLLSQVLEVSTPIIG